MLYNPWPAVLRQARKERGLSQENCAERAEVSEITWYRWESDKVYPGPKVFAHLARGVGLSPAALGRRYAEALLAHYQALGEEPELAAAGAGGERPASALSPAAAAAARPRPEPVLVPGLVPGQGPVYVDLHEMLRRLAEHWAAAGAGSRPARPGGAPDAPPFRRDER